jgi:hypothetical protein
MSADVNVPHVAPSLFIPQTSSIPRRHLMVNEMRSRSTHLLLWIKSIVLY